MGATSQIRAQRRALEFDAGWSDRTRTQIRLLSGQEFALHHSHENADSNRRLQSVDGTVRGCVPASGIGGALRRSALRCKHPY